MIRVTHFPGSTALPLHVASTKGFFAAQGLTVALTPAVNSRQLMTGLLNNDYDIGQAAIDNVIAYQERQAAPELDVQRDLVAFMGTSSTNLNLVVRPAIRSYSDLKGKALAVDAPTTGFAFVLRRMLELGGLKAADCRLMPVGGDTARLDALQSGEVEGALLGTDFAERGLANGLKSLGTSLGALHHYQGTSFFARQSWATGHRVELVRLVRALRQSHQWIFNPVNRGEAARILAMQPPVLSADIAEKTMDLLTGPVGGLSRTGALDIEGIKMVLALRNQYAVPKGTLDDPCRYIDTTYYKDAQLPSFNLTGTDRHG